MTNRTAVFFIADGFEDLEFFVPYMRMQEEGLATIVASAKAEELVTGKGGLKTRSDTDFKDPKLAEATILIVPGGWAPDKLRRDPQVLKLLAEANAEQKLIGLICHAGSVAISAGIVRGKRATGSEGIKDDLVNAGAIWADESAFRDGNLVWGRVVADIPDFCRELVKALHA